MSECQSESYSPKISQLPGKMARLIVVNVMWNKRCVIQFIGNFPNNSSECSDVRPFQKAVPDMRATTKDRVLRRLLAYKWLLDVELKLWHNLLYLFIYQY